MLDAYIYQERRRDLTNLSIQEARLRRQREKDIAELMELQRERIAKRQASLNAAAVAYRHARAHDYDFDPQAFGFEFSIEEIEGCVALFDVRRSGIQHAEGLAQNARRAAQTRTPGRIKAILGGHSGLTVRFSARIRFSRRVPQNPWSGLSSLPRRLSSRRLGIAIPYIGLVTGPWLTIRFVFKAPAIPAANTTTPTHKLLINRPVLPV